MSYKIDYIEFPSREFAGTRRFFAEAFGWTYTEYGPEYVAIDSAGIDAGIDGSSGRVPATMAIVRTDDLEAAFLAVTAAGGEILRNPYDFPGGRRFHFREPGGNELAVWVAV
ncbi:MAG: hypothetical protein JWR75_2168 [Devosia sp.]|nr:hypothetical protein [Devosia sp.]